MIGDNFDSVGLHKKRWYNKFRTKEMMRLNSLKWANICVENFQFSMNDEQNLDYSGVKSFMTESNDS